MRCVHSVLGSANTGAGVPACALKCADVLPHWGLERWPRVEGPVPEQ